MKMEMANEKRAWGRRNGKGRIWNGGTKAYNNPFSHCPRGGDQGNFKEVLRKLSPL